ncbi:TetR/AcrR family transcriptional regulator [Nitratireductor sp. L1-7-SE]|uniref:TetR/AcrR family transcriptional regulator n=2 Tax=Nitratireductor rhodophyticola TaxID=2854036 RepID=A0ABS7RBR9_9HYPH|nr:TetR/AcrR family transcriptional regulator [Nitratireductor rhodophyticola]MBY8920598.1 TetR/AcrR family transcriptional regulator [Nitratireductor rhodophyticola]
MMKQITRTRTDPEETRSRILEVAENFFRSIGYQKTSVADIAAEVGMSPANVYRFFPSKGAINECICGRIVEEVAAIAFSIARTNAPAPEKLSRLLTSIHEHNKATLIKEKRTHEMVAVAMQENWSIIKAHIERMTTIMEGIIREGVEAGDFDVDDPAEAARCVKTAFVPFFHPLLIEHCIQHGEDTEQGLREQLRFILKALGKRA